MLLLTYCSLVNWLVAMKIRCEWYECIQVQPSPAVCVISSSSATGNAVDLDDGASGVADGSRRGDSRHVQLPLAGTVVIIKILFK